MLRNLFGRDYRYYQEKGERLLAEGRYADARNEFTEAVQRLPRTDVDFATIEACLQEQTREAGNRLGEINLAEALHALEIGEFDKFREYLELAGELAEDVTIREKVEKYKNVIASATHSDNKCAGCSNTGENTAENNHAAEGELSSEDRFEILINSIPANLSARYAGLGEKFARAYLLSHDGEDAAALKIFEELLSLEENDIVLYETALVFHREGDIAECERLLRKAYAINEMNPLCCLGLVHLLAETERGNEAIAFLDRMIADDIFPDQSRLLRGDVMLTLGSDIKAMDCYGEALTFPSVAGSAAERLIPLLEGQGRKEEAAYLFEHFIKGHC